MDLAFEDYFSGQEAPFVYPSLVYTVCRGSNSYVPIPYNVSCKVVAYDNNPYFQFNYSTFPTNASVPTFTRNLTAAERYAISNVDNFLLNQLGSDPAGLRHGEVIVTNYISRAV